MGRRTATAVIVALSLISVAAFNPAHLFHAHEQRAHEHKLLMGEYSQMLPTEPISNQPCIDGLAADLFPCEGVDLLSFIPVGAVNTDQHNNLAGTKKIEGSDVWGWVSPETGDRYVIQGKTNGAGFYRVNDPANPEYLGDLPNPSPSFAVWHDIKIYKDHAYIVSESELHGMQVFDLTRLDGVTEEQVWTSEEDYLLESFTQHNIAINEDSGFAYIVGGSTSVGDQLCGSGLHMVDIRDPKAPKYAGCYSGDGYIHDTQCVNYDGPDADYRDREICFNSSETEMSIVDVTDKSAPTLIKKLVYPNPSYTHQGWLTEDKRFFLLGDEADETRHKTNTRTMIFDVTDLDTVADGVPFIHSTPSIDHNMYIRNGLVYQSNYSSGLQILTTRDLYDDSVPMEQSLERVAYFDVFPDNDLARFTGTWSNYPYFGDGIVAVNAYDGLFMVKVHDDVLAAHEFDVVE